MAPRKAAIVARPKERFALADNFKSQFFHAPDAGVTHCLTLARPCSNVESWVSLAQVERSS